MLRALLLKEWIKLRRLAWVPPVLVAAAIIDAWLTMRAIRNNHGAVQVWNALVTKQDIHFDRLSYVLPFCGMWVACVQFLPECTGKRLRLLFHLPVSHGRALAVPVLVGLAAVAAVSVLTLAGLWAVFSLGFHLPVELAGPMLQTVLPWCVAAAVAYLATAAAVADPALHRRIALALAGFAFVAMLIRTSGFAGMSGSLPGYVLLSLAWLLPVHAAALRVKEGR
ncbi:MAG: ABC transporter permease [Magnetospirillum sp.]|nr:ABC transporter permease [Magnetospirillum sp.]